MSIVSKLNKVLEVKNALLELVPHESTLSLEELPNILSAKVTAVDYQTIEQPGIFITDSYGNIGAVVSSDSSFNVSYIIRGADFTGCSLGTVTFTGLEWERVTCLSMIPKSETEYSYIFGHPWNFDCDLEITFLIIPNETQASLVFGSLISNNGARYSCLKPHGTSLIQFVWADNNGVRSLCVLTEEDHILDKNTFKYDSQTRVISSTYGTDCVVPDIEMDTNRDICLCGAALYTQEPPQVIQVADSMKLYKYSCTYYEGTTKFTRNYVPVHNTVTGEAALRDFKTGDILHFSGSGITSYEL